ncbi:hypothetical protein NC653_026955 [Populus alba x Populus x berolinensis]|uniref:Uncharacterized protein n=1 Tax=Populus alba x Populus x berolinensis TaxID=444605 RepID=A0AAD6Q4I1_9ROSI|nr:hypothetical protein NC653_026955 [Populus alba x Populus x berolinensis]
MEVPWCDSNRILLSKEYVRFPVELAHRKIGRELERFLKFEILQKVTLCMCNSTGRAFNTSITAIGPLPPPPPLSS